MRFQIALALALSLGLAGCGDDVPAPQDDAEAAPDPPIGTEAEVAQDAALAARAAQAEAQDAAIGGTLNAAEVSAAPGVTLNRQ